MSGNRIESSGSVLEKLVGEQLSAVVFVQDYLQLDFDGQRLTVNVWPVVAAGDQTEVRVTDDGYRDQLCSLIAHAVTSVVEGKENIEVAFGNSLVRIDLAEDIGTEHLIYEDTTSGEWEWW